MAPWVCLLKNGEGVVHLLEQLCEIPPCVPICTGKDDASCIFDYRTILILDDEATIFFFDKVRHMNDSAAALLHKFLFVNAQPFPSTVSGRDPKLCKDQTHQTFDLYSPA